MRITVQDLDPLVFQAVMAQYGASYANSNPPPEMRRIMSADRARFKPDWRPLWNWMIGGSLAATAAAASVFSFGLDPGSAIGTAIGLWNGVFWGAFALGMVQSFRKYSQDANVIHSDLFAGFIPFLDLSRSERAYCETVAILARPETQIDEETGRQILADLNALIQHSRHLDAQRVEIERLAGADSISSLQSERDGIAQRIPRTQDEQARTDLEESLALCDSRLENAGQMAPALERLDAQQEKIVQTLASIQSRLARLEAAPAPIMLPQAEEVQQTLKDLTNQTRAVEEAVQEVMAVSAR